ncbi:MAG TPA: phosphoglycerate dehydrogenase [Armatimonadota bacterium]|jgi:D-3-phosphoglycerate dehydrogenase
MTATATKTFKVLVSDPVSEDGLRALLDDPTIEVVMKTDHTPEALAEAIGAYDALVIRSQTKVTADILARADKLKVIGRAGVGVDNVDVPAATRKGVVVLNSPEGNTMAATEHTWALLLALTRKVCPADSSMRQGKWDRKKFTGTELYGKTLGVIGLGKIGGAVARRGRGFEMDVVAYDPFVTQEQAARMGIRLLPLDELLKAADFVTIHVPKTKDTADLINAERLAMMKPTARFINCARGGVVNEQALADAVLNGVIAGAAVDVFSSEPAAADNPLVKAAETGCINLLLTPHLGASTEEAQMKVAVDVAEQIRDFFHGVPARSAVNMPALAPELLAALQPYMYLVEQIGKFHGQLIQGAVQSVEVVYSGDVIEEDTAPLIPALLQGLLTPILGVGIVNSVNARYIAEQRGLQIKEVKSTESSGYASLITVTVQTEHGCHRIAGTLFGSNARIVRVDDYWVEMALEGVYIVAYHTDKPGIIGSVGQIFGAYDVNIAGMQVGRAKPRGKAVMVLGIDEHPVEKVLEKIRQIEGVGETYLVEL